MCIYNLPKSFDIEYRELQGMRTPPLVYYHPGWELQFF
jgi:hypothetical protein